MAWYRPDDKPLINWANDGYFDDAYMRHSNSTSQGRFGIELIATIGVRQT